MRVAIGDLAPMVGVRAACEAFDFPRASFCNGSRFSRIASRFSHISSRRPGRERETAPERSVREVRGIAGLPQPSHPAEAVFA